jgi:hypothetical protein
LADFYTVVENQSISGGLYGFLPGGSDMRIFGGFFHWRKSINDRKEILRLSPWSQCKGVRHDMSIFGGFLYRKKSTNDRTKRWWLSP